jgi:hypothetical protein
MKEFIFSPTLIPFGLDEETNILKDVSEVPNGRNSGCICPSCDTPLIARKGEINRWHFAHASKNVYEKTKEKCEYSAYVSIRMMARQIIESEIELTLPDYIEAIPIEDTFPPDVLEVSITNQKKIKLTNVELEKVFSGVSVDIIGEIKDFKFIIYFTHPSREVPFELVEPKNNKCGIISISLNNIPALFSKAEYGLESYHTILKKFLIDDTQFKKWIYHPLRNAKIKQALEKLSREERISIKERVAIKKAPIRKIHTYGGKGKSSLSNEEIDEILKDFRR